MTDNTAADIAGLKSQLETMKQLHTITQMRDTGITVILRKLIEANPGAVHVDDVEKLLHEQHGYTIALRDEGHRRSDINEFLRDVGLMRRTDA